MVAAGSDLPTDDALAARAAMTHLPGFDAGYMSGLMAGIQIGRDQLEGEIRCAWAPVARYVRGLGSPQSRTHVELEAIRRASFATARPVPSVAECEASWLPFLGQEAA